MLPSFSESTHSSYDNLMITVDHSEICSELICLFSSFIIILLIVSLLISILYISFVAFEHGQPLFCILFPDIHASGSLLLNSLPGLS